MILKGKTQPASLFWHFSKTACFQKRSVSNSPHGSQHGLQIATLVWTDNKHGKEVTLATSAFTSLNTDSLPHIHTTGRAEPAGGKKPEHSILKKSLKIILTYSWGQRWLWRLKVCIKIPTFPHSWGLLSALYICIALNLAFNRHTSSNRF